MTAFADDPVLADLRRVVTARAEDAAPPPADDVPRPAPTPASSSSSGPRVALADQFRHASPEARAALLSTMTDVQAAQVIYDWPFWARPEQRAPDGAWLVWLVLAGRGFGKTRTGAERVREVKQHVGRIALVAPTAADARDVLVEGESGIMAISPPWDRPTYEPSKRRVTWGNGAVATLFSADEPDRLRGPQHEAAWCDELAAWRYARDCWDNLMLGLRLGRSPQVVVTTTPKPIALLRELVAAPTTRVTRGSTYANLANLAPTFKDTVLARFEGTTLGRQELHAELLDSAPGALWQRSRIDQLRVAAAPELARVVVAIDPAVTSDEDSNETGIVVAGVGRDQHLYVLEDLSLRASPDAWARAAVEAYRRWRANRLVAEGNQGHDLVTQTIKTVDPRVPVTLVHASRGKVARAEPIAALYEQGRAHHVGALPQLEDQLCNWVVGGASPDRLDALVWAATELNVARGPVSYEYEGVAQGQAPARADAPSFMRADAYYARRGLSHRWRSGGGVL